MAVRRTESQIKKEEKFIADLDKLFDIAHAKALDLTTIEEVRAFLLMQRGGRRNFLLLVEKELYAKEARSAKRKQGEQTRAEKTKVLDSAAQAYYKKYVSTSSSESDDTEMCKQSSSPTMQSSKKRRCTIIKAKNVISPALAQALDRTKVSDRAAVHIIAPTTQRLGHNVQALTINRNTMRQSRRSLRQKAAAFSKDNFSLYILISEVNIVVHWDRKLLSDIEGSQKKYNWLPVLVSYNDTEKLLAVPKLTSVSEKDMVLAVKETLNDWKLENKVVSISFNTTRSNTGQKNETCHLLEV